MMPEIEERIARTHEYERRQQPEKAIASAELAHTLLDDIIAHVRPGVKESDIKAVALDIFARSGIERTWHTPYVRFGDHTLLTFQQKAQEDYMLNEDSIAFVDIGIVKDGIEGDAGRTIAFGDRPGYRHLQKASEAIFAEAREFWLRHNPPGEELYRHIHVLAAGMDVRFNLDPAGHLIGEFPHRGWKKGINHFPGPLAAGCWILEIQIADSDYQHGAFYENLLY